MVAVLIISPRCRSIMLSFRCCEQIEYGVKWGLYDLMLLMLAHPRWQVSPVHVPDI
jgi:hypothetical protein